MRSWNDLDHWKSSDDIRLYKHLHKLLYISYDHMSYIHISIYVGDST